MWVLKNLLELPGMAEESSLLDMGCMAEWLTLLPHQRAQVSLSLGSGGFGISSAEARRMSASVGSLVETLPAALADFSGIFWEKVRRNLPESELVTSTKVSGRE